MTFRPSMIGKKLIVRVTEDTGVPNMAPLFRGEWVGILDAYARFPGTVAFHMQGFVDGVTIGSDQRLTIREAP